MHTCILTCRCTCVLLHGHMSIKLFGQFFKLFARRGRLAPPPTSAPAPPPPPTSAPSTRASLLSSTAASHDAGPSASEAIAIARRRLRPSCRKARVTGMGWGTCSSGGSSTSSVATSLPPQPPQGCVYQWWSARLSIGFCLRTRRCLPQHWSTLHFWCTGRGPDYAPKWPEQMGARAQMPGERGSSTSRRRTGLRSVCGRLTTDRRRHKVHIRSRTERPPALARAMCMY